MTPEEPAPERRRDPRLRLVGLLVGAGVALAVLAAALAGATGNSGAVAAVVLLLVLGASFAVASLVALGSAVVDEFRGRPVGRARVVVGLVLFVATVVVMAMAGLADG